MAKKKHQVILDPNYQPKRIDWDGLFEKCNALFYELPDGADVTIDLDRQDFESLLHQKAVGKDKIILHSRGKKLSTEITIRPRRVLH
jgi:hypothetical protein